MNSEREIIKRLLESKEIEDVQDLDEKTYTVGDVQYWRRGGVCYKWTSSEGRSECTEEEYMKAISGGSDVKNTEPKDDKAKSTTPSTESSASLKGRRSAIDINGKKYYLKVDGMKPQEVVDKYNSIAKHSPGKAIQWAKNHGTLTKIKKPVASPKELVNSVKGVGDKIPLSNGEYLEVTYYNSERKVPLFSRKDKEGNIVKDKVYYSDAVRMLTKPKKVKTSVKSTAVEEPKSEKDILLGKMDHLEDQIFYLNMKDRWTVEDSKLEDKLKGELKQLKDKLSGM